ncbi:MAG: hypothetical protein AAF065_04280 [Verrucomicrobiota bacterium]
MPLYRPESSCIPHRYLSLICLSLSSFLFVACGKNSFSSLEPLPVSTYLAKPGDFLGNTYLLTAQIDSQIKWEEGVGRILAVVVEGSSSRIPVFVSDAGGKNLHVGQRYEMRANILEGGLIYVEELRKF